MSDGGVYTQDQVEEFSRLLNYPKVQQAIKNQVVNELFDQSNHYLCLKLKDTIGATGEKTNIFSFRQHLTTFLNTFGEITEDFRGSQMSFRGFGGVSELRTFTKEF